MFSEVISSNCYILSKQKKQYDFLQEKGSLTAVLLPRATCTAPPDCRLPLAPPHVVGPLKDTEEL